MLITSRYKVKHLLVPHDNVIYIIILYNMILLIMIVNEESFVFGVIVLSKFLFFGAFYRLID